MAALRRTRSGLDDLNHAHTIAALRRPRSGLYDLTHAHTIE